MKNDDIRQLRVNDGVSLRGHVSKKDGDKVLITFPEINSSVWVWERNVHQDFFVRSTPPEERWSYNALKHAAEKMKAEIDALKEKLEEERRTRLQLKGEAKDLLHDACVMVSSCASRVSYALSGLYRNEEMRIDADFDIETQAHSIANGLLMIWEKLAEGDEGYEQ